MMFPYCPLGPCSAGGHPYHCTEPFTPTCWDLNTRPLPGALTAETEHLPGARGRLLGITGEGFSTEEPLSHILGVPLVLPRSEAAGVGRNAGGVGQGRFSHIVKRLKRNDQWIRVGVGWGRVRGFLPGGHFLPRESRLGRHPQTSVPRGHLRTHLSPQACLPWPGALRPTLAAQPSW